MQTFLLASVTEKPTAKRPEQRVQICYSANLPAVFDWFAAAHALQRHKQTQVVVVVIVIVEAHKCIGIYTQLWNGR